jgi:hypothetical protein
MKDSPVFIVGNRRSGTTLLRLMIASHGNIGIPPEGGFIVQLGWKYDRIREFSTSIIIRFLDSLFELDNTRDWELDKISLLERLEELTPCDYPKILSGIYEEYLAKKFPGKTRWGDKTTWYLDYLPQIDRYFPHAQYIHIIRDGRALAASYKRVSHLPNNIENITLEWCWSVRRIIKFGRAIGPERYLEVFYEDLVRNTEEELKRICYFLGEPYDSEMLDFWLKNRQQHLEPERHLGWKSKTLEQVTQSQISLWRSELKGKEIAVFWFIAGRVMDQLGYGHCESELSIAEATSITKNAILYRLYKNIQIKLRSLKSRLQGLSEIQVEN